MGHECLHVLENVGMKFYFISPNRFAYCHKSVLPLWQVALLQESPISRVNLRNEDGFIESVIYHRLYICTCMLEYNVREAFIVAFLSLINIFIDCNTFLLIFPYFFLFLFTLFVFFHYHFFLSFYSFYFYRNSIKVNESKK